MSNITWRQGRQLLRQYLQEIGYTETIIDIRSNRVRSLLGLNNNCEQENENVSPNINGGSETNKRASESQGGLWPAAIANRFCNSSSFPLSLFQDAEHRPKSPSPRR